MIFDTNSDYGKNIIKFKDENLNFFTEQKNNQIKFANVLEKWHEGLFTNNLLKKTILFSKSSRFTLLNSDEFYDNYLLYICGKNKKNISGITNAKINFLNLFKIHFSSGYIMQILNFIKKTSEYFTQVIKSLLLINISFIKILIFKITSETNIFDNKSYAYKNLYLPEFIEKKNFFQTGDHFFGNLINNEKNLFYYLIYKFEDILKIKNLKKKNIFTFINFIEIKDLFIIYFQSIYIFIKYLLSSFIFGSKINFEFYNDKYLAKDFLYKNFFSSNIFFQEINFFVIKKIITSISFDQILFPFERKGYEQYTMHLCRKYKIGAKTLAFVHQLANDGHRYLYFRNNNQVYKPDLIGSTGQAQKVLLNKKFGWDNDKIIILGSPRKMTVNIEAKKSKTQNILFITSYYHELESACKILNDLKKTHNFNIYIRTYPYAEVNEQNDILKKYNLYSRDHNIKALSFHEQINWSDFVFFSSSSASIEAMQMNKPVIRIKNRFYFDINPFDFENSILSEVENTEQSLQILHDFKSEKFLTDYLNKQKKYSLNFYEEINL